MADEITADELQQAIESDDRLWSWLERSGEYDNVNWEDAPVETGVLQTAARRALSALRSLTEQLAEAKQQALPEGCCGLSWEQGNTLCEVDELNGRWYWTVQVSPEWCVVASGDSDDFAGARTAAIRAAETAAEEGDHADA